MPADFNGKRPWLLSPADECSAELGTAALPSSSLRRALHPKDSTSRQSEAVCQSHPEPCSWTLGIDTPGTFTAGRQNP